MCLEIKKGQRAKIAKEDIKCYKVIKYKYNNWVTFFKQMEIEEGTRYWSDIEIERYTPHDCKIIKALHSFISLEAANNFLSCRDLSNSCTIVECIIPKGAKYYIGKFECEDDAYASDVLIYPNEF